MNITNINASGSKEAVSGYQQKSNDISSIGKKGDIIEGVISEVSDKVAIDFSGTQIKTTKQSVPDAKEGQVRKFRIMDISKDRIALKEIGDNSKTNSKSVIYSTVIRVDSGTFAERLERNSVNQLDNNNKDDAKESANKITEDDCEEVWKEGFSLEAFEAGRLARALERIKQNKEFQSENLDVRIENQKQWKKEIEKISVSNKLSDSNAKNIAKKLIEADIPLTDENIEKLIKSKNMAETANSLSDSGMAYMIQQQLEPTINNIYHSSYLGTTKTTFSEETWHAIKGQVEDVLKSNQFAVNEENMEDAKWLFEHELPITGESLEQYKSLSDIKNSMTGDVALDKIIEAMKQGIDPEETNLDSYIEEKLQNAIEDFSTISNDAVSKTLEEGKELTLPNLKEVQNQLSGQNETYRSKKEAVLDNSILENMGTTKEEITAYRQLQEIRLKLTLESSQRLAANGIRVDTSQLQDIVEGLKNIEDQFYKNLLKETGAVENDANVALLRETTEKVNDIKQAPVYFIGTVAKQAIVRTIDTIHGTAMELKTSLDKAGEAYETMMTVPRRDLGDSIEKAFQSIDSILQDLDIEVTGDNERAAKILGYNRMEITKDSIMEMKAYDSKVSTLIERLHPAVTVELIKKGINPLNMPIDELNNQIQEIRDELGISKEEKYSTYLWKLEKENGITEEERKSYIGIYRLLNNVEQTNGAAIGSVLNSGGALTMSNLLTAVRTMKGKGIDAEVNDSFGGLESLTFAKETITEQISSAYGADSENSHSQDSKSNASSEYTTDYMKRVLEHVMETITPSKLMEISNGNITELLSQPLDVLKDKLELAEGNKEIEEAYCKQATEMLRETLQSSEEAIDFLDQFDVPVTVQNIMAAGEYYTGNKNVFKELQKKADTISESEKESLKKSYDALSEATDSKEQLEEAYEALEKTAEKILNKGYETAEISSSELATLKMLGAGIHLTGMLGRQEHYEIPILVSEDRITNINLTIVKGTKESGKVQIGMNSERFGKVEAEVTVKDNMIKGFILCETMEGTETIKECLESMTGELKNLGLEVKQLSVGTDEKAIKHMKHQQSDSSERTETKMLYQTAKVFVQGFKAAELN